MKKIRISKLDALFSKYIRLRDNYTCVRCGRKYEPPTNAVHCSHFWGRSHKGTRFDERNADALCYGCHARWESDKHGDYRDFKLKQLGEEGYRILEQRARSVVKESEVATEALEKELKEKINELQRLQSTH